jgi:hypothetical protein
MLLNKVVFCMHMVTFYGDIFFLSVISSYILNSLSIGAVSAERGRGRPI